MGSAQLLLLFSAGGANHCHLQKETQNATTIQFYFVLFLDLFPPVSAPQLWIVIGFLLVAAPSADGRSGGGAEERLGLWVAAVGGEAVEAGGASVVFAPVVGRGGWPCC